MKALFLATTAVAFFVTPAFAAGDDNTGAQVATLKQKEAASQAESAKLRRQLRLAGSAGNAGPLAAASSKREPNARAAMAAALPPASYKSWAGFYVGGGFGRNRSNVTQGDGRQTVTVLPGNPGTPTDEAVQLFDKRFGNSAHFLAGYLFQFDKFLIGAEGDFTLQQAKGQLSPMDPGGGACGVAITGTFICSGLTPFGSSQVFGHARAVAGMEITPRFMGFVSGGAAFGRVNNVGTHIGILFASSPSAPIAGFADSVGVTKNLVGYSIGGGVQAKVSNDVVARLEYLHDEFSFNVPGVTLSPTLGAANLTMTAPATKARFTNDTVRGSLIWRFDPNAGPGAAYAMGPDLWTPISPTGWAGFYGGGGISQHNYRVSQAGGGTISIHDSSGVVPDYTNRWSLSESMSTVAGHAMFGYRYQWNRFLFGFEADTDIGARKIAEEPKSPGQFGAQSAQVECFTQFQAAGALPCVGLAMKRAGVRSEGHFRLTTGYALTENVAAFVGGGVAYGYGIGIGSGAAGVVSSSPSAPLVGAATVVRTLNERILGGSIGGGIEIKATENLSFRGEYMFDWYTWNHAPVGGAGFGGTIGNVTVNSFAATNSTHFVTNELYRASVIYRFWNPQGT